MMNLSLFQNYKIHPMNYSSTLHILYLLVVATCQEHYIPTVSRYRWGIAIPSTPFQGCTNACLLQGYCTTALVEKFCCNFKYSPSRCAYIYSRIINKSEIPDGYEPKHLLWTLHFLLTYATERRMCCFFKADRKTIRKYTWPTISAIASLHRQYVSSKNTSLMK